MNATEVFIRTIPLTTLEEVCENCSTIPLNKIIEEYPSATNYLISNEREQFIQHYLNQINFYSLETSRVEPNSESETPSIINSGSICWACKENLKDEYKFKGFNINE